MKKYSIEKRQCPKCKQWHILENHHILPKSTFGENNQVQNLCPNCHAEYHRVLGDQIKNTDMAFHFYFYEKWLAGLLVLLLLLAGASYYF